MLFSKFTRTTSNSATRTTIASTNFLSIDEISRKNITHHYRYRHQPNFFSIYQIQTKKKPYYPRLGNRNSSFVRYYSENKNGSSGSVPEAGMDEENTVNDPPLPVQPINIPGTSSSSFTITKNPTFDAALTTFIGLGLVFIGGVGYWEWYKSNVLFKIEKAFAPGYDPALELARRSKHRHPEMGEEPSSDHLRRREQDMIDRIIHGEGNGRYYVLIGCKGSGKGTMIIDAMEAISADGVAICEAHPDLEVFRLRLGKALNFEYNEDTQTSLFQRRDPREGGPALDIERGGITVLSVFAYTDTLKKIYPALNKLEKVALKLSRQRGRPLVLIINNIHLFRNDENGQALLLQLQQRAESWSESGILTMVFSTDDFWPYLTLRKTSNRMQVLSLYDLSMHEAIHAFKRLRTKSGRGAVNEDTINQVLQYTGGRLAYINKTARSEDPLGAAKHILETEKGWLLSQIGLIPDCDDDVMDEQKWSSCSWLLMREFVKLHLEQLEERKKVLGETIEYEEVPLPSIPYWRCRQIMTRADFLEALDHANIISIDIHNHVRPDSMIILRATMEVVQEEGFDELLDNVRDRVDEIESLHRTRELTFKDLGKGDRIRLSVDKAGPS